MGKIILNMNMTLDGFFNLDWMGENPFIPDEELIADTMTQMRGAENAQAGSGGGALVGYPFYMGMIQHWPKLEHNPDASESERAMAQAVNNSQRIVVSRTEVTLPGEHAQLLVAKQDDDLVAAITNLKQQAGSDFTVIGGVRTAQKFVRLGLVDEYVLLIHPVIIGHGSSVFADRLDLEVISTKTYKSGVTRAVYWPRVTP